MGPGPGAGDPVTVAQRCEHRATGRARLRPAEGDRGPDDPGAMAAVGRDRTRTGMAAGPGPVPASRRLWSGQGLRPNCGP